MSVNHVPNRIRREESDAKIINAAMKNFGTLGYTNCSIAQIAKDAGVSPGLITSRYSSKDVLFSCVAEQAFAEIKIDTNLLSGAIEFLRSLIEEIKRLNKADIDVFNFLSMVYVSLDKPESFNVKAREDFRLTRPYALLLSAQNDGVLQKGDIIKLLDAYLAHAYIQIGICEKYGIDLPSTEYFLSAILSENMDDIDFYNQQFINFLLKEYQSAWLIKLDDLSIQVYKYNEEKAVPYSVQTVSDMKTYDEARFWYIENCVVEQSKNSLLEQTDINYILPRIKGDKSFFIEYGRKSAGEINFNQLCYNKVVNRKGEIEFVAMGFRNIDISKRTEVDDLTGIYTRQKFFEKAEELIMENLDVAYDLLISDIVDFKKINETYGVKVADKILKWESDYLVNIVGNRGILGRYGGDQIVIIGPHEVIADIVSKEKKATFLEAERSNGLPEINVKFGVYRSVKREKTIVSTCDKAHMALNSIKYHYEKDIAYYDEDIKMHIEKQRKIESSMHKSLKNGDFKVYYQPKHCAKTGKLIGAEALIRWIHPEYGFMSPGDFIPLFEQNGFVEKMDSYVWRRTCENIRQWMDKGIKTVPISVNASRITMTKDSLLEDMVKPVEEFNLSPEQLHVEVTETLMSDNVELIINVLEKIRELGFKVELDDFGSGYSSLNVLSTFPIDVLKLDMSFLHDFGERKRSVVLESCIDMAKKLGFITVSEGVELKEQEEVLGELGVDMIQGYYHSKPLPEEEFEKYMLEHC